ncbi:hypothetical protein SLS53_004522 [Cytospora paraplurivora]|uniref:Peptidase M20 dimerisation domain-containing protein n=1 Tax=Cytospora paraplurivora TaxID=2898453 RepID=A0AAN9UGE1_9PEZI
MRVRTSEPPGRKSARIHDIIRRYRPEAGPFEQIYKDLHANPELSCQELQTAQVAAGHLRSLGLKVIDHLGGSGVIGVLENGHGRTVLLRAELDALPVLEKTSLPYASTKHMIDDDGEKKPVMHACGHDMHIASLMAATTLLVNAMDRWSGRLLIVFQPNEERGGGAAAMINDGLYGSRGVPRPDVVLGQHIVNSKAGIVEIGSGYALAGKKTLSITIPGKGGHAGDPHKCIDPLVIACYTVTRMQSVVSRELDPNETAIITCGKLRAGDAPNVIPDKAEMAIEVRAYSPEILDQAVESLKRVVRAECQASGINQEPVILELESVPPLVNSDEIVQPLERQLKEFFGATKVQPLVPDMSADDFSLLAPDGIPYAYWTMGCTDPEVWEKHQREGKLQELPANHSPYFFPAIEPTLESSIDALAVAALTFLDTS